MIKTNKKRTDLGILVKRLLPGYLLLRLKAKSHTEYLSFCDEMFTQDKIFVKSRLKQRRI